MIDHLRKKLSQERELQGQIIQQCLFRNLYFRESGHFQQTRTLSELPTAVLGNTKQEDDDACP